MTPAEPARETGQETAQLTAQRCADLMWAEDTASRALGMQLIRVSPGHATIQMTVTEKMVNGHGIGHGGFTFCLADSAFAFACNTYNRRTVARACEISYLLPTHLGDVLVAEAAERCREGRDGTYDVTVRRAGDPGERIVAEFVGRSRQIRGSFLPDDAVVRPPNG